MKIAFFGSPEAAIPTFRSLIEGGHRIVTVVTQPDKPAGRGLQPRISPVKRAAFEHGLPVLQPVRAREPEFASTLGSLDPGVFVVVAYGQILPPSVLQIPPYGSINVHFSLLPKYRGAAPVQWAILNGETETGVTIMRMDAGLDTGPILAQRTVGIRVGEDAPTLEARLAHIGASLLAETLDRLPAIKDTFQDARQATYAPLLKKTDGRIDWAKGAEQLWRKLLALGKWPGVFFFFGELQVKLIEGRPANQPQGIARSTRPGEVLKIDKGGITVSCGSGGFYQMTRLQPPGKGPMDARSFANGYRLAAGTILT